MAKKRLKMAAPCFSDFVRAAVFAPASAQKMVRENPAWLSVTSGTGETALADVVIENYLDAAKFLLECGADVNTPDHFGQTPLMQAAGLGYQTLVVLLLEHGAEVNARDESEETALFKAAHGGYSEICELLLLSGAEGDRRNDMEQSVFDVILPRKWTQVVNVLERHGYRAPAYTAAE